MKKKDELTSNGCLNKADDNEMLFVLRAQDVTSPKVVLYWMIENMHLAASNEAKFREAFECVMEMTKHKNVKSAD